MPLAAGTRLGTYEILNAIGAGGMGEVYRAHDDQLHRIVAIKVLPTATTDDPAARGRLVREARAAAALNHPHICTVHQVGEADGQTFIAMELVEGATLSARLADGPLPPEQVVRYGIQLADALAHAHERGIVHRDLKCANVIVTPEGRIKVLDFGLAKRLTTNELTTRLDATVEGPGTIAGTLAYMAPEQLRGQPALAASDVWALGAMLYEMTQAARPFRGQTTFELSAAILNDAPAPLEKPVPAALQAVIRKCLEKEPGHRYGTGTEVRAALEVIQSTSDFRQPLPPTEPIAIVGRPRPRGPGRRRTLLAAIGVLAVAAIGYATWLLLTPAPVLRTLAILPFENVENDERIDYVAEGLTDGLVRRTRLLPSMKVTKLGAVPTLAGRKIGLAEVGRELKVESVVTGTVKREGESLLVTAHLTEGATGAPLWQNTYTLEVSKYVDVVDEIATQIMNDGLKLRLDNADRRQRAWHPTNNPEAYRLYLQANHLQRSSTEEGYLEARKLLEDAVRLDQKFAAAYASLGGLYAMLVVDGYDRPNDAWPQVGRYMRESVALDPRLVEIHAYDHAIAVFWERNWKAAEQARVKLLRSVASEVDPQFLRALPLERLALGFPEEAVALARRIGELDPYSPDLATLTADYLMHAGQLDAAVTLYRRAISLDDTNKNPVFGLAEALFRQRKFDEAIATRRDAHEVAGDSEMARHFAAARGEAGYRQADRAWAEAELASLKRKAAFRYVSPYDLGRLYARLGDHEQAFKYLDDAFIDRAPGLVLLNIDQAWDPVRNDSRFLDAIGKAGLPEPKGRK